MRIGRIYTGNKKDTAYFFVNKDGEHLLVPNEEFEGGFSPFNKDQINKLTSLIENTSTTFKKCAPDSQLAPPIHITGITCIGMNYKEHAEECGADWTKFIAPTIFGRSLTSVNDPFGDVMVPKAYEFRGAPLGDGVVRFDYEAELGVVIGKPCYNVTTEEALNYVAGYMVAGDYSERTRQLQNGSQQWHAGKCLPTSFTAGPYLVTSDEIPNPQALRLKLWVNEELRQDDSTESMIFSVAECISALSQTDLLPPGFVISTGTPKGVVTKGKPEQIIYPWLKAGDVVKTSIFGDGVDLGTQIQKCIETNTSSIKEIISKFS